MSNQPSVASVNLYPKANANLRYFALWYFAILLIVWTIVGHLFLGFEQSYAHSIAGMVSAMATQLLLEWVDSIATKRPARFAGGIVNFLNFMPPAIITGLACAMLLYPNDRIAPIVFASVLSIASKVLFRIRLQNGSLHHFFNPSNFGIVATLLLLPWVGQAPPYQFTANITGIWHWVLPMGILASGIFVHSRATGRLPLCMAWVIGFIAQGVIRSWLTGNPWYVPLMPMSSATFVLFTLFMVPDPATTPILPKRQVAFGVAIAAVYGVLQMMHVVFGLFLSLILVCTIRGVLIAVMSWMSSTSKEEAVGNEYVAPLGQPERVPAAEVIGAS